jgi:hypothetical protein
VSRPSRNRIPGVPGVPVGGVAGGGGLTFRVVSRGSCARAAVADANSDTATAVASSAIRPPRRLARAEIVVRVSLTPERTVYFTL